ncbi:MAG TPA: hypothetical protein VK564_02145 [Thermodesulfobacteriota bacterium]|nr:hypothetical protein [Thermodesulfobacteriota bacterium]
MRIWVNDQTILLADGMTVRSALIRAGLQEEMEQGARVLDGWGHEIGLDGALEEGSRIRVVPGTQPATPKRS